MGFIFEARKSGGEALRVETVMRQAYTAERGGQYIYEQLQRQGLGYKKQDVLTDYRRFQAVDRSLTPEARGRAETWFDKVYEPFRKANNMNAKQASEALLTIKGGTINTSEEANVTSSYLDLYEAQF